MIEAVYVFPASQSGRVDVFIVRPGCPTGQVLFFTRLASPG